MILTGKEKDSVAKEMYKISKQPDDHWIRLQVGEVIMHSAVYAGVPQALRSMQIAYEVFEKLDREDANVVGTGD